MAPSQRRLYCVFSDDLRKGIAIDCTTGKDDIAYVQGKIWETDRKTRELLSHPGEIELYSPKRSLEIGLRKENLVPLSFHQLISSSFPQSGDEHIHIVIKRPETYASEEPPEHKHLDYNPKETCRRNATLSQLASILNKYQLIHIRGTPTSGKTTLAFLLQEYYHSRGKRAFYRSSWKPLDESTLWQSFTKHFGCPDEELEGTVFLLDEAQRSYDDEIFWNRVVKSAHDQAKNIKICLFSSYGSPSTGLPQNPKLMTPVLIPPRQRVSIMPTFETGAPKFGLFYDLHEFDDVVTRLSTNQPERFTFEKQAKDYIFKMTNGHPGAVKAVVLYVFESCRSEIRAGHFSDITEDHLLRALRDENTAFDEIAQYSIGRSFPNRGSRYLTTDAQVILKKVLEDGNIPFDIGIPGIKTCYEMGWMQRTLQQGQDICVFPSALHEKYIEYLFGEDLARFPDEKFPTIQSLCKAVIEHFSAKNLRLCQEGRKISTAGKARPLEAQYQDEFYRAFSSIVPGIPLSSEWSRTGNGRIDFWIKGKNWGIELLRDHKRVEDHCSRFKKGGQYYPWVEEDMLKEWIIIDCATSPAAPYPEQKLWRAIFNHDYSKVQLFDNTNSPLTEPIDLVNI